MKIGSSTAFIRKLESKPHLNTYSFTGKNKSMKIKTYL